MLLKSYLIASLFFCIAVITAPFGVTAHESLVFSVPNFPPYAYEEKQQVVGDGVEKVKMVLDKMGVKYHFRLVANHGAALEKVRSGLSDGFFLATRNAQRDRFAVMSNEVVKNNWAWFYLPDAKLLPEDDGFKEQARIGTRMNTNTFIWLKDQGYQVASVPNEAGTLAKMLIKKRIDAVFLASNVFQYAVKNQRLNHIEFKQKIESSNPFGVYFSKRYIADNPTFLAEFNRTLAELN